MESLKIKTENGIHFGLTDEAKLKTFFDDLLRPDQTREETINVYKTWAFTYDHDLTLIKDFYKGPARAAKEVASALKNQLDGRILDCGAGTGLVGQQIAKLGFTNIDALDASPIMLNEAKQKNIYTQLLCDNLGPNKLNIESDTYDALVAVGCFDPGHIKPDALAEMIRVTKPGGHIVLILTQWPEDGKMKRYFEETVQSHESQGLWSVEKSNVLPLGHYFKLTVGLEYVFCVL